MALPRNAANPSQVHPRIEREAKFTANVLRSGTWMLHDRDDRSGFFTSRSCMQTSEVELGRRADYHLIQQNGYDVNAGTLVRILNYNATQKR